ncbi:MAG: hypothetical protein JSU60_02820, partial [Nitrospirota bacterium]
RELNMGEVAFDEGSGITCHSSVVVSPGSFPNDDNQPEPLRRNLQEKKQHVVQIRPFPYGNFFWSGIQSTD